MVSIVRLINPKNMFFWKARPMVARLRRTNASIGRVVCPRGIFGVFGTVSSAEKRG